MRLLDDYLALVTSEHADKPKFLATLTALLQPLVDAQALLRSLIPDFDLDTAIGVQLDAVGVRIGRSRFLEIAVDNLYFSLDIEGAGLDQASWWEPFNPTTQIIRLPDEPYRTLLRAVAAANEWDGTIPGSYTVWGELGFVVLIQDYQDMSMIWALWGPIPDSITMALLTGPYIKLRPAGVRIRNFMVETVEFAPFFGLDVENTHIAGLDVGAWGKLLPGSPDITPMTQPFQPGGFGGQGGLTANAVARRIAPAGINEVDGSGALAVNAVLKLAIVPPGTPVSVGQASSGPSRVTTLSLTLASPIPAGTVIVISTAGVIAASGVADSAGNSYVNDVNGVGGGSEPIYGSLFHTLNALGLPAGGVIAVSVSGSDRFDFSVIAISGVLVSSDPADGVAETGDSIASGSVSITTTTTHDILIGAVASKDSISSQAAGFTTVSTGSNDAKLAFKNDAVAGSQSYAPVMAQNVSHVRMLLALKPIA